MRLGIMQPYFFPYTQQFRHIGQCDLWIVFDTPKFSRKSWVNRNRILNPDSEWSYISAPVEKGASNGPICDAALAGGDWRETILNKLKVYERGAPFYRETLDLVHSCLDDAGSTIAALNTRILGQVCSALSITTPIKRISDLSLNLPSKAAPGEWALLISKELGADIYSNAPGGRDLFDPELYSANGVTLEFYEPKTLVYETPGFEFTPDLSVIDALMWMGADALADWCHER